MANFWRNNRWLNGGGRDNEQQYNALSHNIIDESRPAPMAIIYRSEMDYISRCILDCQNIETGGQLFGYLTEYGVPVVCYAIGPGRNANHQKAFFNQDTQYLQSIYNELNRRYQLQYIGEWHSHHQLGLAQPSGHDAQTIVNGITRHQFRHFLLCIGNCSNGKSTLNAFTFHLNSSFDYEHVPWKICEMISPYRPIADHELSHMLIHPYSRPNHGNNYIVASKGSVTQAIVPNYKEDYWLNNKSNNLVLKNIIDYLTCYSGCQDIVKPMLGQDRQVYLQITRNDRTETVIFGPHFPFSAPNIEMDPQGDIIQPPYWTYLSDDDDIYGCFTQYYEKYIKEYYQTLPHTDKESEQAEEKTTSHDSVEVDDTSQPIEGKTSEWNYWQRFK